MSSQQSSVVSDINSTAATRGTPHSPLVSSYASPGGSVDISDLNYRSPGTERGPKRRRLNFSATRIDQCFSIHEHSDSNMTASDMLPSLSPNLPGFHALNHGTFKSQQSTFLGHDREFISLLMSARSVVPRMTEILRSHGPVPETRGILDYLPVASPDSSRFIGWREKAETWPSNRLCHIHRFSTTLQ